MARCNADVYNHLVDRKSNLIINGGENIYPPEVEGALGAHPKVKDVAVIGVPDASGARRSGLSSCCTMDNRYRKRRC